jgi:S-adenosylmethionine synthetase
MGPTVPGEGSSKAALKRAHSKAPSARTDRPHLAGDKKRKRQDKDAAATLGDSVISALIVSPSPFLLSVSGVILVKADSFGTTPPMQRALITGASGFLGREMMRAFASGSEVTGVGHAHAGDLLSCDLRDEAAVEDLLIRTQPDVVIHGAAYRDPDPCEQDPDETRRLNTEAVGHLVRHLPDGTKLVYVCTDYVFDGTSPPYREDDVPNPVNVYGRTKLEGEKIARSRPGTLVLRIPLLIGAGASPRTSGFITQIVDALRSREPRTEDDVSLRFPTWTRDVAEAAHSLVMDDIDGVVHISTEQGHTRYGLVTLAGKVLGMSTDHVSPSTNPTPRPAPRPANSQLAIDRWRSLGGSPPHRFEDVLRAVVDGFGGHGAFRHG